MTSPSDDEIRLLLQQHSRIAVVGLSTVASRPSHRATLYMQQHGYDITPVNPRYTVALDRPCYPDLLSIPHDVDVVNLFQRAERVLPFVEQAIEIGAKIIWMQLGIVNEEAARLARAAGLQVIMDRCMKIEHQRLLG